MSYDLIILGGGPAGYSAAERAAENGLKTLVIEKRALGGVCLNEGCIPTKTLLYSAKILDTFQSASKYAIKVTGTAEPDLAKIISRKNKVVRKLVAGIRAKMTKAGAEVIEGEGRVLGIEPDGSIRLAVGEDQFVAKDLLIATGSEAFVPPIPGVDSTNYWTSREALQNKELPPRLAIIGGGVIGMEFASFFNSLGSKVTVIEMLPEILGGIDAELSAQLRAEYTKRGVTFLLGHKVTQVSNEAVTVTFEDETIIIDTDQVLMSVGRRPVADAFTDIPLERKGHGLAVDGQMRTSIPHIYAAGDVTGQSLLAHTAIREAEVAVNTILGRQDEMSYRAIPGVVYTNPEIASVGATAEGLDSKGIAHTVKELPMSFSGRFVAENEQGNGVCKLIISEDNRLLGAHFLGNPAGELVVIAGIAIEQQMSVEELEKIIFPHPTVAEIIRETLMS